MKSKKQFVKIRKEKTLEDTHNFLDEEICCYEDIKSIIKTHIKIHNIVGVIPKKLQ